MSEYMVIVSFGGSTDYLRMGEADLPTKLYNYRVRVTCS